MRQVATRSALVLTLGLALGSCDKAINVQPSNSISSTSGFTTKEDAAAGLLGVYDAVQSSDYCGLAFPALSDLISGDILFRGTFTTTYGVIGQNQAAADNIQIGNTWGAIYTAIARANYLIQQSDGISDPAFPKVNTIAQARALRAFSYMNLLALWGGTSQGYGYTGGLGVPLRLTPTTAIGPETAAIARSSEADVATAIRADLDYAIANLSVGSGTQITKSAALALRARFELRMRQYASALQFAQQVPVVSGFSSAAIGAGSSATDVLWQLAFNPTDQSQFAFYWYPSPGGRNEFDPGTSIAAAHPSGDKRLAINVNPTTVGTTQKYTSTTNRDDPFNAVRYAEVVLTIAEAAAQTGDLATATANLNIIRNRAGLAATTATTAAGLITDILLQRRLEFAYEGMYWYDMRRTNTIQTTRPTFYSETFRNLFPIPQREVQLTNGLIAQNPNF